MPQPRSTARRRGGSARARAATRPRVAGGVVGGLAQGEPVGAEAAHAGILMASAITAAVSGQSGQALPGGPGRRGGLGAAGRIGDQRAQGGGEGRGVAGRNRLAGTFRHRLGGGAPGGGDEGQSAGQGLGQSHAVALEQRGRDREVGLPVEPLQGLGRHRARERDAVAETRCVDPVAQGGGTRRRPVEAAGDRERPVEIRQPGKRPNQHVVALARGHGADGEQPGMRALARHHPGGGGGAGLGDGDPRRRHAELGREQPGGVAARRDDTVGQRQGRALGGDQRRRRSGDRPVS